MPELRTCEGCGKEYWWPGAKWQHDKCSLGQGVEVPEKGFKAKTSGRSAVEVEASGKGLLGSSGQVSIDGLRVKLWRDANRERYNATQREVMRRKREKEKAA